MSENGQQQQQQQQQHYIQLEPTVQTEVVTTTKKTIINYPEIPIHAVRSTAGSIDQLQLPQAQYPLSRSTLPKEISSFNFSLPNGHIASYHSGCRGENDDTDSVNTAHALLHHHHHQPPKKKLREDLQPTLAGMNTAMMSTHNANTKGMNMGMGTGIVGSSGSIRSPLPSPLASPPRCAVAGEWDSGEVGDVGDVDGSDAGGSSSSSSSSNAHDNTNTNANATSHNTLPVLLSFPHLLNAFPSLSTPTQSHVLLNLLRSADINTIRHVQDFIEPALKKDFIRQLPLEISSLILTHLDIEDLARAAQTSKTWRRIIDHDRAAWKYAGMRADLWFGDEDHVASARCHEVHDLAAGGANTNVNAAAADGTLTPPPIASHDFSSSPKSPPRPPKCHPYKQILRTRHTTRINWFNNDPKSSIEFERHGQNVVTCLQFDADKIVTASDGEDKSIDISCTKTGRLRKRLRGHTGGVWALQYQGDTLVSGATDRTVRVWDIPTGRCTHVLWGHFSTVRCLAIIMPKWNNTSKCYEPPYPIIVSGSRDFTIRIWRLPSPTKDEPWNINDGDVAAKDNPWPLKLLSGHTNAVRSVAGEGRTLVSGSYDFTVRVWNTVTGQVEHVLRGHNDMVYKVVLDAARNRCASGSYDGSVKVWSTDNGELLQSLDGHSSLVGLLGLNSSSLVSAGADSNLKIWDLKSGDCRHVLDGHDSAISCMAHDEQKIISGSDGMLKMWNARDGRLVKDVLSNLMHIWQVAISDRYLVAASNKMSGQTFINVFDFGGDGADDEEEEVEPCRLNWEHRWWMPVSSRIEAQMQESTDKDTA